MAKPAFRPGLKNGACGYGGMPLFQLNAGAKPLGLGNVEFAEKPSVPVPLRAPLRPPTAPRRVYMTP